VLLLSSSPSRFRTFRAPPKGGACAPSRGRRGLVPVVRRRGTAWRSGIPTRPPVLKISRGSPARSFTPTGAVGGSLQGVGPIVPARGGGEAGKLQRPDLPYTLPTLYLAVRDEPRPCPTTYPTPTLHLGRTAPVSRGLPYTYPILGRTRGEPRPCPAAYPTPTLYLAARGEPRPCPRPTLYSALRRRRRLVPPCLPFEDSPRPSPSRLPRAYPTKPSRRRKSRRAHAAATKSSPRTRSLPYKTSRPEHSRRSPPALSPPFLCTHPPERVKVREI
jgi:hypothetical protein